MIQGKISSLPHFPRKRGTNENGAHSKVARYTELKYSSLHKKLFEFLDNSFIYYPDAGNPNGFFDKFFRPDYLNTPV